MTKISKLVLFFMLIPVLLQAQQHSKEMKADSLFNNNKEKESLELYRQILEQQPKDYTALWRSSLLYSRIGNRFDDEEKQENYFNKAIDLAERSLQVDSSDTHSNYVMAVAMGRKALISGSRERVAASRAIKKFADRALSYDSTNAGAWHVLGRWHFKVANLNWIERAAANTLFGGIPGDASNKKAAEYLAKAINLNEDYLLYYYDLAQVYVELGQEKKAVETCIAMLQKPERVPGDSDLKEQCQQLIQDLR